MHFACAGNWFKVFAVAKDCPKGSERADADPVQANQKAANACLEMKACALCY